MTFYDLEETENSQFLVFNCNEKYSDYEII